MSPSEIKLVRSELKCTAKELGAALGIDQATVMKWESGELFPTKKYVDHMNGLRAKGPAAVPRKARGAQVSPMQVLADPTLWQVVRKLIAHKKLRDEVIKIAAAYGDPNDTASDRESSTLAERKTLALHRHFAVVVQPASASLNSAHRHSRLINRPACIPDCNAPSKVR